MVSVQALDVRAHSSEVDPVVAGGVDAGGVGAKRRWNGCVPPPYTRCKLAPAGPRTRWWRRDAYIALDEALGAGEIPPGVAQVVRAVLAFSDDTGRVSWPSWATIGRVMGCRSGRTAGFWLGRAKAAGWLECEHRCRRLVGGVVVGDTNLWRVVLPAAAQERLDARKQAGRTEARAKQHPTRPAPQNRSHGGRGVVGGERSGAIDPSGATRSLVAGLWRTGLAPAAIVAEIESLFTGAELEVALVELARLRAGP